MLAKSNKKITLVNHSRNVSIITERILKETYPEDIYNKLKDVVKISGLLHDIGKATPHFQKLLKKGVDSDSKKNYTHNIVSWAFTVSLLDKTDIKEKQLIYDSILYHHGIYSKDFKLNSFNILKEFKDEDILDMLNESKEILSGVLEINSTLSNHGESVPEYYDSNIIDNSLGFYKTISRGVLIFADRFVSSLEDDLTIDFNTVSLDKYINKGKKFLLSDFKIDNSLRSIKQKEIVETINKSDANVFVLKASAGFGKTRLGLLWNLQRDKRLIWVAPRNDIASSLYESITKELKKLGIDGVNVSCYYSNEVQKGCDINDADIIITNIDSFLANSFKSNKLYNLSLVNTTDVIFDEYHEIIGDDALFSLFLHFLKLRNSYTNAKTLLLSATPLDIEFLVNSNSLLFDGVNDEFMYLPSKYTHYSSQHDKPYNVNIGDFSTHLTIDDNTLVVCNSIAQTQEYAFEYDINRLYHSEFTSEDRRVILDKVLSVFGEGKEKEEENENLIGARALQSSLDISLGKMYEMVFSPESTLQRIGRVNRWGEYKSSDLFLTSFLEDESFYNDKEKSSIIYGYDLSLHKKWYKLLGTYHGKSLSLDELYIIYNQFHENNKADVEKYIRSLYVNSLGKLKTIYPKQYKPSKLKTNNIKLNSLDSLRGNGNAYYFTCKYIDDKLKLITPISKEKYITVNSNDYYEKEHNESENHHRIIIKNMPILLSNGFDFSGLKDYKKARISDFRILSNSSISPYYRTDVVYHKKYGVIKKESEIFNSFFI